MKFFKKLFGLHDYKAAQQAEYDDIIGFDPKIHTAEIETLGQRIELHKIKHDADRRRLGLKPYAYKYL